MNGKAGPGQGVDQVFDNGANGYYDLNLLDWRVLAFVFLNERRIFYTEIQL
ncbi:MAG: hypothetical protein P8N76_27110 [Pirellulaceae bacterium]|nr:hypothetical protein [Pirellulaceae bacterium]